MYMIGPFCCYNHMIENDETITDQLTQTTFKTLQICTDFMFCSLPIVGYFKQN